MPGPVVFEGVFGQVGSAVNGRHGGDGISWQGCRSGSCWIRIPGISGGSRVTGVVVCIRSGIVPSTRVIGIVPIGSSIVRGIVPVVVVVIG